MLKNKLMQGMKLSGLSIGIGVVTKVYKSVYKADVFVLAFNYELQHVPIMTLYAGNGYGLIAYPAEGDIVLLAFVNGQVENPVIIGRMFTGTTFPPSASNDEIFIKHSSGTKVRIDSEGVVHIEAGTGKKVVLDGDLVSGTIDNTATPHEGVPHTHTFTLQVVASSEKLKAE